MNDDAATAGPVDVGELDPCHLGTVLELSTAHVSEHEMSLLTRFGTHQPGPVYGETVRGDHDLRLPRMVAHEWGVFVVVSGTDPEELETALARMRELHLDGLARIYELAVAVCATLVNLDADAAVLDRLPVHDW